jgi:hypothetical protein
MVPGTDYLQHDEVHVTGRAVHERAHDARHPPARPQFDLLEEASLALEFCVMLPQTGTPRGHSP